MTIEPSREDRYEAAVRAVLDLCDREELDPGVHDGLVPTADLRAAIRAELAPVDVATTAVRRERIEHVPGYGIRIEEVEA
ncbi:hypothetical protein SEA_LILMAC1015_72 [Arthrobacter phage Lilmac1015]|uniref:Uncharacterized protein n=1 Tax=Arthrobacter phage Lilmac1015 TaxID=2912653 RepID=A0AA49BQA3_9CAUD|nr:hypothetical protein SEA_LILMAC1015_72 [Arthrobacter phage Lilmac1015]